MIDLYSAYLLQRTEIELQLGRIEHLYWDVARPEPWFSGLLRWWRRARLGLGQPRRRAAAAGPTLLRDRPHVEHAGRP